jgi:indolepyruvate ferredoxin oxidoreductase
MSSLDEKYDLVEGTVVLSGTEALARLPIEQRQRDQRNGLNSGGFICGYRGSPLGTYDLELWRIQERLTAVNVRFQPGINEDLAAAAVWGTQYVNLYPGATVDGVFGIWYGKTPGVERSADALHHANTAGTSPTGGVLALAGDDHAAKSSSRTGQSELQLKSSGIPILYPSNVQEILDYGLHGIAMSRFSGCWIALKLATDVVETSSEVQVGTMPPVQLPPIDGPPGGLHIDPTSLRRRWKRACSTTSCRRCWPTCVPTALTGSSSTRRMRATASSAPARVGGMCAVGWRCSGWTTRRRRRPASGC